ncbi:hypothetical protein [Luteolibacter marinus]|uniref:hypothetical protein n=1 Tax=Luteolibacter marinus TaxID=2776705 RepID=UPI0018663FEE|nr:hypothetical protein [Luteolibacter marinus]
MTRHTNCGVRGEAMSNLKQVGLNLSDFEVEYGAFPDATTRVDVKEVTGTTLTLGTTSSNQMFRQLIATGVKSEKIFWAKSALTPRKPDDVSNSDATALAPGECAFTYVAGMSSHGDPKAPLAMVPVIPGTWKFDPKPYQGEAFVLTIDGTLMRHPIDKHGHVMIGGKNLFDPGQPYWRGKTPDIKWPE